MMSLPLNPTSSYNIKCGPVSSVRREKIYVADRVVTVPCDLVFAQNDRQAIGRAFTKILKVESTNTINGNRLVATTQKIEFAPNNKSAICQAFAKILKGEGTSIISGNGVNMISTGPTRSIATTSNTVMCTGAARDSFYSNNGQVFPWNGTDSERNIEIYKYLMKRFSKICRSDAKADSAMTLWFLHKN